MRADGRRPLLGARAQGRDDARLTRQDDGREQTCGQRGQQQLLDPPAG